ncbi:hypothetical protein PR202_ga15326 [Eleusine coracana subsp. coracana]|uniref:Bidirectional sugar transporter SWEET n=1 Tax=Eleusine coracana subsp. coracana TaxID=191504 RepID=A0AAV5CJK9_ELECO|nr:hypothetical protein PR202_ga15326 [Eleusine coracana subsp. coracana]
MAGGLFSMEHPWASAFGILGNIVSFLVFLAPTPTFLRVYRKKSTEGFSSVPYVVALFSCALWIFYALVKTNSSPLLTINAFGCVVESAYILIYLIYAPRTARLRTLASFFLVNVTAFSLIVIVTLMLVAEPQRVKVLGSICLAFSMAVFVAPMRQTARSFMPFSLSFFLTLSAVAWFFYGLFTKDLYVALPNVGGFFFSFTQMVLYFCYRKPKPAAVLPTTATDSTLAGATLPVEEVMVMELPLAVPEVTIPVLAELQKLEQQVASPRKAAAAKAF